jgi:hypothetical protein
MRWADNLNCLLLATLSYSARSGHGHLHLGQGHATECSTINSASRNYHCVYLRKGPHWCWAEKTFGISTAGTVAMSAGGKDLASGGIPETAVASLSALTTERAPVAESAGLAKAVMTPKASTTRCENERGCVLQSMRGAAQAAQISPSSPSHKCPCSTLFLSSTLSMPDNNEICVGVATVLHCQIVQVFCPLMPVTCSIIPHLHPTRRTLKPAGMPHQLVQLRRGCSTSVHMVCSTSLGSSTLDLNVKFQMQLLAPRLLLHQDLAAAMSEALKTFTNLFRAHSSLHSFHRNAF